MAPIPACLASLRLFGCPLGLLPDVVRFELWRLTACRWRFRKTGGKALFLYYDPVLSETIDVRKYVAFCDDTLEQHTQRFRFSIPTTPAAYLFARASHLNKLLRTPAGARGQGYTLLHRDAIALCPDCYGVSLQEVTRHEFTHLFSRYVHPEAPPLNSEGLAVALQLTEAGKPIDFYALVAFRRGYYMPLQELIRPALFQGPERYWAYVIAGSFTSYLIGAFGWETYLAFYRQAGMGNYEVVFADVYGLTLQVAQSRWHAALVIKSAEFEVELNSLSQRWFQAAHSLPSRN